MNTTSNPRSPSPFTGGVTLRDIGRHLGISHVTVSLALRNAPQVSAARRKQIQDAAREMGYRPNPMAAALGQLRSTGKPQPVAAALAWINNWDNPKELLTYKEFALYWKGAHETAAWYGYNLEEFIGGRQFTMARLEKMLVTRGVNGILIPPQNNLPPGWDSFAWQRFSVVRFGHSVQRPLLHIAGSDQLENTALAFNKIRDLGYERIGFVSGGVNRTHHLAGFLWAQWNLPAKLRLSPLVVPLGHGQPFPQKLLTPWLKKAKPDAILTDVAAMRTMLKTEGYRVPDDIGLAACTVLDGNADAGIYQKPEEIGKAAMELLISLINHQHTGIPKSCRQVLVEGEWVDGTTLPRRK